MPSALPLSSIYRIIRVCKSCLSLQIALQFFTQVDFAAYGFAHFVRLHPTENPSLSGFQPYRNPLEEVVECEYSECCIKNFEQCFFRPFFIAEKGPNRLVGGGYSEDYIDKIVCPDTFFSFYNMKIAKLKNISLQDAALQGIDVMMFLEVQSEKAQYIEFEFTARNKGGSLMVWM